MVKDEEQGHDITTKRGLFARLRSNFLTGVIFILPLALTLWFIWWAINFLDSKLVPFVPDRLNPNHLLPPGIPFEIPGVGLIFFLIVATVTGALTKGLLGRQLNHLVVNLVNRFPVVRSVYNTLRQIFETVFSDRSSSFQQACIIEYPRRGIYAVGFVARRSEGEIRDRVGREIAAVFVPTTPNPTSGFFLYFPVDEITILDMSVEEAAKLIISAGLVEPPTRPRTAESLDEAAQ